MLAVRKIKERLGAKTKGVVRYRRLQGKAAADHKGLEGGPLWLYKTGFWAPSVFFRGGSKEVEIGEDRLKRRGHQKAKEVGRSQKLKKHLTDHSSGEGNINGAKSARVEVLLSCPKMDDIKHEASWLALGEL